MPVWLLDYNLTGLRIQRVITELLYLNIFVGYVYLAGVRILNQQLQRAQVHVVQFDFGF